MVTATEIPDESHVHILDGRDGLMPNRNPKRKRGISVDSSPSLTLRVTMAAARLIQENTGILRLPDMFTAVASRPHNAARSFRTV